MSLVSNPMSTMSIGTVCSWATTAPGSRPLNDGERRSATFELALIGWRALRNDGSGQCEQRQGKHQCKKTTGHRGLLSATCRVSRRVRHTVARRL